MRRCKIKLSYPSGKIRGGTEKFAETKIETSNKAGLIYDLAGIFENHIFPGLKNQLTKQRICDRIDLREIFNIHNQEGLQDVRKINIDFL